MKNNLKNRLGFTVLVLMCWTLTGCETANQPASNVPSFQAIEAFGSEVNVDGRKTRLFGCLEEDEDCFVRSEKLNELGCDMISAEKCAGCDKLDLKCLNLAAGRPLDLHAD